MSRGDRVVHANCFPPADDGADLLLTDEMLVAAAAPSDVTVSMPEQGIDEEAAHLTSMAMSRAAFRWFRAGEDDHSIVSGISAGDLAGGEAALTVLMPAARGVLTMLAALEHGVAPTTLVTVVPGGDSRYARLETLAADAAAATARARLGSSLAIERVVSRDPRNSRLREKYARARDPDYLLVTDSRRKVMRNAALGMTNLPALLRGRRRPGLLVLEYNPSHAFARIYGTHRHRHWRLVCLPARPRDLIAIARGGDEAILPLMPDLATQPQTGVGERLRACVEELDGAALRVAGIDLWPIVRDPLLALAERYGRYAAALAQPLRHELERRAVRAVLVPFDVAAPARLIVRVAQTIGIPTFVINDGYKVDDIQEEGMTADVALAWSAAMSEHYYSRRSNAAVVTGNPRSERRPSKGRRRRHGAQRVLVGGHTFSPIDLNCRRSDAERFLDEVLDGISAARPHVSANVLVKLHPGDALGYYREILRRHSRLGVELRLQGDVLELFNHCDVYVTTYSTSLLEALASGLPVVYYQINAQRLGPPFSNDEFLARRSASTPAQLTRLLTDSDVLAAPPPAGWIEHYLGPTSGATDRVIACIERHIDSPAPVAHQQEARLNV